MTGVQTCALPISEIINADNGIAKLNTRLLEESKLLSFAAKKWEEGTEAQEEAIERQRYQTEIIKIVSDTMSDYVTDTLSGSLDEFQTFGDTLILMSLQILKSMVPIWAAKILGYSLSSPESVATWGVLGMVKFTAITGLMYAGIAALEGAVRGRINKKRQAASETVGYAAGGYTNGDRLYRAGEEGVEFIGNAKSVRNPSVRKIFDIVDLAQQNGTIATIDLPAVMNAAGLIPKSSFRGNIASEVSQVNTVQLRQQAVDPELKQLIVDNTAALRELINWKPNISVEMYERKREVWNNITKNRGLQ